MSDRALRGRIAELEAALDKAIAALKTLKTEYNRLCAEGVKLRDHGKKLETIVRSLKRRKAEEENR